MPDGLSIVATVQSASDVAVPFVCMPGLPPAAVRCATTLAACSAACSITGVCAPDPGGACLPLRAALGAAGGTSAAALPLFACQQPGDCFPGDPTCAGLCGHSEVCAAVGNASTDVCAGAAVPGYTCKPVLAACYADSACWLANASASCVCSESGCVGGGCVLYDGGNNYGGGAPQFRGGAASTGRCVNGTVCSAVAAGGACATAPAALAAGTGFVCAAPTARCYSDASCDGWCTDGTVCAQDVSHTSCPAPAAGGGAAYTPHTWACLNASSCFGAFQAGLCSSACFGHACEVAFDAVQACASPAADTSHGFVLVCAFASPGAPSPATYMLNVMTSVPVSAALGLYLLLRLGAFDGLRRAKGGGRASSAVGPEPGGGG